MTLNRVSAEQQVVAGPIAFGAEARRLWALGKDVVDVTNRALLRRCTKSTKTPK